MDRPNDFTGNESIILPVSILPRDGKHYGTVVVDAKGAEIARIWSAVGKPSEREKEYFGADWTPEAWSNYCCGCHWESEIDWEEAQWLVAVLNAAQIPVYRGGDDPQFRYAIRRGSFRVP